MLLFHMLWTTIYCDVPSSHRYHLRMTLYSQLLWNIPDDIISLCKKYQMLVIVWRLGVESLSDCHTFRFRTWLLAKTPYIYIYSFNHFFHPIRVIFHIWVFLWTALFAHWHKDMQNWSHEVSSLFLATILF